MLLSHTQHHGVLGVAQLQNCHLHIGNGVTRLVEMVSSCLVQVRVPNISQMLLHPSCIGSCRNSHIIHLTFRFGALDVVHIKTLHFAVDFSIDMNNFASCCSLHSFGFLYKIANCALFSTIRHTAPIPLGAGDVVVAWWWQF